MTKKEFLNSLNDVYCRIGRTTHGVGLVAIRPIPKGTNPFKHCDPYGDALMISKEELISCNAPDEAKKLVKDFCPLQNGIYYVPDDGIDCIDKSYFINHSTNPNLTSNDRGITFITARDIETGEELTADYDFYDDNEGHLFLK